MTCDYGVINNLIWPVADGSQCVFDRFEGTAARFSCRASSSAGVYSNACRHGSSPGQSICARTDAIASTQVLAPAANCVKPVFKGGSFSPSDVARGGSFSISCDYGLVTSTVYPSAPGAQCSFVQFAGTEARFSCQAPSGAGGYAIGCIFGAHAATQTCERSDALGVLSVR